MSGALRLEAIITTVDAVLVERQLARHPVMRKQIALADRLVLTKTDMAEIDMTARVASELRRRNPLAPIDCVAQGKIAAADLLPPGFLDPATSSAGRASARSLLQADPIAPGHADDAIAVALIAAAPLRWRAFDAWLRGIRIGQAERLLRLKGLLNIAGMPGPVVIQGVEHVMHAPVKLERWPDADRRSRIVLITSGIVRGAIEAEWNRALPGLAAAEAA